MTSPGGDWMVVQLPDAPARQDWIPHQQPPSPDGGPGAWHVVPDPAGGPSRWEWFPAAPAPVPVAAPAYAYAQAAEPGYTTTAVAAPAYAPSTAAAAPAAQAVPPLATLPQRTGARPPASGVRSPKIMVAAAVVLIIGALVSAVLFFRSSGDGVDSVPKVSEAEAATIEQTALTESGCQDPRPKLAQEPVSHIYKCHGFDLYIYNVTHYRDLWVAEWQKQGHTVLKTGAHWITLQPQPTSPKVQSGKK